jgi:nicotinamide riboside kinase
MNIAILGAKGTGKTQLAQALVKALAEPAGGAHWVPATQPEWRDKRGRTPEADAQSAFAATQIHRVNTAPAARFLLSDTTALMTAIYSELLFDDASLYPDALAHHRDYELTLVMGLDLPWVANDIQPDDSIARARVDARLRQVLQEAALNYVVVYGQGAARTDCALQAIAHHADLPSQTPRPALPWQWNCDKCSDGACEHRMFTGRLKLGAA